MVLPYQLLPMHFIDPWPANCHAYSLCGVRLYKYTFLCACASPWPYVKLNLCGKVYHAIKRDLLCH